MLGSARTAGGGFDVGACLRLALVAAAGAGQPPVAALPPSDRAHQFDSSSLIPLPFSSFDLLIALLPLPARNSRLLVRLRFVSSTDI